MRRVGPACMGLAFLACLAMLGIGQPDEPPAPKDETVRVLVFSKTAGFRHDSIPAGIKAMRGICEREGFEVDATEDSGVFTDENLERFGVIVFMNTTGDVLNDEQQGAMERFIRVGKGFVGVHAASDTEYDWAWYGDLVGARFAHHPAIQEAVVIVEDDAHPSTSHLAYDTWTRRDEWYDFKESPRKERRGVLLRVDESSYEGGRMGEDHPIAWHQEFDGGRSWYTAMGHTKASYTEEAFVAHLRGGLMWAAGVSDEAKPDEPKKEQP